MILTWVLTESGQLVAHGDRNHYVITETHGAKPWELERSRGMQSIHLAYRETLEGALDAAAMRERVEAAASSVTYERPPGNVYKPRS